MAAAALGISVSGLIASTAVGLPPLHVPTSAAGLAIAALQCLNLASFANERRGLATLVHLLSVLNRHPLCYLEVI
jgi:hypothetical protein